MSSVIIAGNTSGSITLSAPAISGSSVLTLPVATDTLVGKATTDTLTNKTLGSTVVQASNAAPAFSAYQSSAQTLSSATGTKITFTTEVFDTNSNFASSTFTPTVAGYYQINFGVSFPTASVAILYLNKNGATLYKSVNTNPSTVATVSASNLVYLNGSTDYVEVYAFLVVGQTLTAASTDTYFSGAMVRSA